MPENKIQLCLISPFPPSQSKGKNYSTGGIATWTGLIIKYATNCSDINITMIDSMPKWRSVHNFPTWKRLFSGAYGLLKVTGQLFSLLATKHIDIIHLTTSGQIGIIRDISVISLAKIFNKPVVYHIRYGRIPQISEENNREWKLISYAMVKAHTVIVIDKATKISISKHLPRANVTLVPNCINLSNLSPQYLNSPKKRVLFVGWVVPTKGIIELLNAWRELQTKHWQLQIIGPSDEAYLQKLKKEYPINNIQFLGEKKHDEVINYMKSCDIFVLPSYTEGFPNVVLEAMALGRPIVATAVGAIPEMLEGGHGYLVNPKDSQDLKNGLQTLISNHDKRKKMGDNAKKRALSKYSIDVVFARYHEIWQEAKVS